MKTESRGSPLIDVLFMIMMSFTLILAFVVTQLMAGGDALEGRVKDLNRRLEGIKGTPHGKLAMNEVEVRKALQRLRLENAWLIVRGKRRLPRLLQDLGNVEDIRLANDRLHLPAGGAYSDLRQEVGRLLPGPGRTGDVPQAEVRALLLRCLATADLQARTPDRVDEALSPAARDFFFEDKVVSVANLRHLARTIRSDLAQELKQVEEIQIRLVEKIALARLADGPDAAGKDDPREVLRELVVELKSALNLLPAVERRLQGPL